MISGSLRNPARSGRRRNELTITGLG